MSGEILLAREGDIATVTLSNPGKLNALGLGSWKRLGEVMRELDADKSLRCIVMRGAGDCCASVRCVARYSFTRSARIFSSFREHLKP